MEQPRVERKLAAILAADVAGYSRLMGLDEEGTLALLKAHRRALFDPKLKQHHGRIVKTTGDGLLVEFASVVDAVRAAAEIQRGMAERNAATPPERRIEFRIGINLGDVIVDGKDIFGDGVNVAARLEALAEPGGICVSRGVRDPVRDKLGVIFEDMGEQTVKNIARPVHAYRVRFEGVEPAPAPTAPPPRRRRALALVAACTALLAIAGSAAWFVSRSTTAPPTPGAARLSIVVLPFANLSGDPAQEYFADVVTENVTTDISRLPDSFVIARNTAFTYKGKPVDVKQVARELSVRYVLEGSVQRAGDTVRVNVQLLDGETGSYVWAERFDHERADLAQLEDEISVRLARTLRLQLYRSESDRSARAQATDPDSADLAMRGLALLYKPQGTAADSEEAFRLFEQALQRDGRNVEALVGLAQKYNLRAYIADSETKDEDIRQANELVARALAIDPDNFWAHQRKGQILLHQRRFEEAIVEEETSLALNPSNTAAYEELGAANFYMGFPERAIENYERLIRLSPRDIEIPSVSYSMGTAYFMLGDLDRTIEWERKCLAAAPDHRLAGAFLAAAYALTGREAEARDALAEHLRRGGPKAVADWGKARASDTPRYLALRERLYEGLRKAGLTEK